MLMRIIARDMPETQAAPSAPGPIDLAWQTLHEQLMADPALGALVRILNGVELRSQNKALVEIFDRDLADALRLKWLAQGTLNALYPEIVDQAVEETAQLLCEADRAPFEVQRPDVQVRYRRLAQSAVNAYTGKLEGRS